MTVAVQHVAITRPDGSLAILQFVTNDGTVQHEATDAAINATIAKAGIPVTSWRRITPADIPGNRADRDAWQDNGVTITVDATRKAALLDARREQLINQMQTDALRALYLMIFDAANEIRVLKGQAPLNAAQFKTYAKGKLS